MEAAKTQVPHVNKDGTTSASKYRVFYTCAACKGQFTRREVQVDHIVPIGAIPDWPPTEVNRWDKWLIMLFCHANNLQCLCVGCHSKKSIEERRNVQEI